MASTDGIVKVARCPVHGLHGQRDECFVCGGPVEQVRMRAVEPPDVGVGMPHFLLLDLFGQVLWDAFGETPYHVGSSLRGKQWRDVDVRMLCDEALDVNAMHAFDLAFSALGKQMTGLPIDFQLQRPDRFHKEDGQGRSSLGVARDIRAREKVRTPSLP